MDPLNTWLEYERAIASEKSLRYKSIHFKEGLSANEKEELQKLRERIKAFRKEHCWSDAELTMREINEEGYYRDGGRHT